MSKRDRLEDAQRVEKLWSDEHYGAHVALWVDRNYASRAWDVGCSCGQGGMVCDGIFDDAPFFIYPEHRHMCVVPDAMAAMANVMACVYVAMCHRIFVLQWAVANRDAADSFTISTFNSRWPVRRRELAALASREWSAEVRRKVKALKPSGPCVSVQGEED